MCNKMPDRDEVWYVERRLCNPTGASDEDRTQRIKELGTTVWERNRICRGRSLRASSVIHCGADGEDSSSCRYMAAQPLSPFPTPVYDDRINDPKDVPGAQPAPAGWTTGPEEGGNR